MMIFYNPKESNLKIPVKFKLKLEINRLKIYHTKDKRSALIYSEFPRKKIPPLIMQIRRVIPKIKLIYLEIPSKILIKPKKQITYLGILLSLLQGRIIYLEILLIPIIQRQIICLVLQSLLLIIIYSDSPIKHNKIKIIYSDSQLRHNKIKIIYSVIQNLNNNKRKI